MGNILPYGQSPQPQRRDEFSSEKKYQPGELLEMYRRRGNLSQAQLAGFLGLKSERMLQKWEGDYTLPSADKLKKLIEIYLAHELFQAGRETVEARQLWQTVKKFFDASRERSLNTYPLFDELWFAALLTTGNNSSPIKPTALPNKPINLSLFPAKTERPNHNLPAMLNRLIGRESEISQVSNLLQNQRLLTLTGPGGTGKTRLALAVATEVGKEFKGGVWWVELATVTDSNQVASAIALTLGLKETVGQTTTESLKSYLSDKEILLVLDNFEQVIAAGPLVTTLLTTSAGLKILVTSRETLHVYSEQKFNVPPLPIPDLSAITTADVEQLSQNAAIQLFVERARLVQPGLELTPANVGTVAKLCIFLEGLPLAIELAAAQSEYFSPASLLGQLQNSQEAVRLRQLVDGPHDVLPRQQTLWNTLEWGFQLLEPEEQQLFAELGVFIGGWTVGAAAQVCSGQATTPMLTRLQKLTAKSLVTVAHAVNGEPRFGMLETIREFAQAKLATSGKTATLRRQHVYYYENLAQASYAKVSSSEQKIWLERLEQEYANLRAALEYTFGINNSEEPNQVDQTKWWGVRLATALGPFWFNSDYLLVEGRGWITKAYNVFLAAKANFKPKAESDFWEFLAIGLLEPEWQTKLFYQNGVLAFQQFDYVASRSYLEQSLEICDYWNDYHLKALSVHNLGVLEWRNHQVEAAERLWKQSIEPLKKYQDFKRVALCLSNLSGIENQRGNLVEAVKLSQEAVIMSREANDKFTVLGCVGKLAMHKVKQKKYEEAILLFEEVLTLAVELGSVNYQQITLQHLANLKYLGGDLTTAWQFLFESLNLALEINNIVGQIDILFHAAKFLKEIQPEKAVSLLSTAQTGLNSLSVAWSLVEDMTFDDLVAELKTKLTELEYAKSWKAGQEMTLNEAFVQLPGKRQLESV